MATSSAPQAQTKSQNSLLQRAAAARAASTATAATAKADPFAEIKANPVYQAVYSTEIKDEQKPAALAAIFAAPQTETEARAVMKQFEQVKSYAAAQRVALAQAMIKVQQSETQVELQRSLKDLNEKMLQFEVKLKPVTDVLSAIYKLSVTDKAYDAFKEIKRDQALIDEARKTRADLENQINTAVNRAEEINRHNVVLEQDRNWLGNIRSASVKQMALNNDELANIQINLSRLKDELSKATANVPQSELDAELVESKEVVAKFLDLSDTDVRSQQEELFTSALEFIDENKARVGNMRNLLSNDESSILKMVDASEVLGLIYATMTDACNIATDKLRERREALLPKEGEVIGAVEKQIRAKKLKDLDAYIETFEKEKGNTLQTTSAVTELQEKLGNLKRNNAEGVELTRIMHTDAMAEVAEGLSTTLTSLSTAAIGQSANIAKSNMKRMNALTNRIAQEESIRGAMSEEQRVREIDDSLASLQSWTDVITTKKEILEGTFTRFKERVGALSAATDVAKDARSEAASVAARIVTADEAAAPVVQETADLLKI